MPTETFLRRQLRRSRRIVEWTREGRLRHELWERRGYVKARLSFVAERTLVALGWRLDMRGKLGLPAPFRLPDPKELRLPTSEQPVISVVIPAYGQLTHCLRCLATLAAYPPALPFEVILAEDASGDPEMVRLRDVQGLRFFEWPENLGFLRSANAAMAEARGEFLFLLNNDTEVMPGALDALHAAITVPHMGFPGPVGLAGARLLYPKGWLQEAGGLLWRDGSAWNWGNWQDPRRSEYTYLREVDYCSGAAIMLPRAAWEAMGGFDEEFLPAYCEDTDLAFRLRAAGWRTLYVPSATVIHHEGASHGTDVTKGIKAHQVTNLRKLHARHRAAMDLREEPATNLIRARDRAPKGGARRVVLLADNNLLTPDQDAGSRATLSLVEALLTQGHVVKFWALNGLDMPGYRQALEALGVECPIGPRRPSFEDWARTHGAELDEVILSRPHVAEALLPALKRHAPHAPILYYGHDLHHERMEREAALLDAESPERAATLREEAARLLEQERTVWAESDLVIYLSDEETEAVRRLVPGTATRTLLSFTLPEATAEAPGPEGREGLLFVAGFAHPPNVDAATWLVGEILPRIEAVRPGTRLALVGSNPTPAVAALAGPRVEVTGRVSDAELRRRYAKARVAICPLRFGAGVKLKVVEAMQEGLPLVTTPVGVQGLRDAPCAVADDAQALADAALRLLNDEDTWRTTSIAQHSYVRERLSPAAVRAALEDAFTVARRAARESAAHPPAPHGGGTLPPA
ncbi:glycosyltransferase [Sabulicella glaciei]|uniref:Glycosyltransferase n=1 Tax=Sabulicella glaciei TaxID=2984948 RepID=A0ABT3NZY8_9PROT|nr:glycosyltransferase [Roseococcus sp. MDT2-1-1]MCW8087488.1 glycosyltransferase [Roseococcus sp. MDT2-1-1]